MKKILLILPIIFGVSFALGMDTPVETPEITLVSPLAPGSVGNKIIAPLITIIAIQSSATPSAKNGSQVPKTNSKNLLTVNYNPNKKLRKSNFEKDPFANEKPRAKTLEDLPNTRRR